MAGQGQQLIGAESKFEEGGAFDVSKGPRERSRGCTDCLCLILFVGTLAALGVLAAVVFAKGDSRVLEQFVYGNNFQGQQCGFGDLKDYPYVFYTVKPGTIVTDPAAISIMDFRGVCTNLCPVAATTFSLVQRNASVCQPGALEAGLCTWYGGETDQFTNFCLDASVFTHGRIATFDPYFGDILDATGFLVAMFLMSFVIGFLALIVIRRFAKVFVWATLISTVCLVGLTGYYMWDSRKSLSQQYGQSETTFAICGYIFWGVAGLLAVIVMCSCRSINLACAMLKTAVLFLQDVKSAMVLPIISTVFQMATMVFFGVMLAFVASIGLSKDTQPGGEDDKGVCLFEGSGLADPFCVQWASDSRFVPYAVLFTIFVYFWSALLLQAWSKYTTAFMVGEWYFAPLDYHGVKQLSGGNTFCDCRLLIRGMCSGLAHHMGSFAFGALLVAICRTIQLLLSWAKRKEKATGNACTACIFRIMLCIVTCVERFISFVTEQAYIQIALLGRGFCTSAKAGFGLAVRHPLRFAIVGRVGFLLGMVGCLLTTATTAFVGWLLLTKVDLPEPFVYGKLTSPTAPLAVVTILALLVGETMFHPYTMSAKTIMHCFTADEEMSHSAGRAGATHTPPPLQRFVEAHCDK